MAVDNIISAIDAEITRLQEARAILASLTTGREPQSTGTTRPKRTVSTAARKKIATAQRKRWAALKERRTGSK